MRSRESFTEEQLLRIDRLFGGDIELYENEIKYSARDVISWKHLVVAAQIEEPYETKALDIIKATLGYLPPKCAYIRFIGFIYAHLKSTEYGVSLPVEAEAEIKDYCRKIRNVDIIMGGWLLNKTPQDYGYESYNSFLPDYIDCTKKRLASLLGYVPQIAHSLEAELYLRPLFSQDFYFEDMPFCEIDYKAAAVAHYKKIFIESGRESANKSPILPVYTNPTS